MVNDDGRINDEILIPILHSGATTVKAISNDPIRGLTAAVTPPPKALVPAPLVQKEPCTGYSYQQINCLDSIIRFVHEPVAICVRPFSPHQSTHPAFIYTGTWRAVTFLILSKGSVAPPPARPMTTNSRTPAATAKVLYYVEPV